MKTRQLMNDMVRAWCALLLVLAACQDPGAVDVVFDEPGLDHASPELPLTEMGHDTYLGFEGGLYPGGNSLPPPDHASVGRASAARIRPLDAAGNPSPDGKYVLMSIGMSNTTQEFCGGAHSQNCQSFSFIGRMAGDPLVDRDELVIVDGARGGQSAGKWISPSQPNFDMIRDTRLAPFGLSEAQVQAAWVKVANPRPIVALPDTGADAYLLVEQTGDIIRSMKARYPNLQMVFLSSRIYAGYATSTLNPEPFAFESGLAVKWVVEAQIGQERGAGVHPLAGDLSMAGGAPWVGWGPYLWANGEAARGDGLAWSPADFRDDGTHPSDAGRSKVGGLLQEFFTASELTRCWVLAGENC